jgi:hypothetical protein
MAVESCLSTPRLLQMTATCMNTRFPNSCTTSTHVILNIVFASIVLSLFFSPIFMSLPAAVNGTGAVSSRYRSEG